MVVEKKRETEKKRNPCCLKKGHSRRTIHFGQDFHSRRKQRAGGRERWENSLAAAKTSRGQKKRKARREACLTRPFRPSPSQFTLCLSPRLPFSLFRNAYLPFSCDVCLYAVRTKEEDERKETPFVVGSLMMLPSMLLNWNNHKSFVRIVIIFEGE